MRRSLQVHVSGGTSFSGTDAASRTKARNRRAKCVCAPSLRGRGRATALATVASCRATERGRELSVRLGVVSSHTLTISSRFDKKKRQIGGVLACGKEAGAGTQMVVRVQQEAGEASASCEKGGRLF